MPLDSISELEDRVEYLISAYQDSKKEKEALQKENQDLASRIGKLEKEKEKLQTSAKMVNGGSSDDRAKLDAAAEKIRQLITKLETVE